MMHKYLMKYMKCSVNLWSSPNFIYIKSVRNFFPLSNIRYDMNNNRQVFKA